MTTKHTPPPDEEELAADEEEAEELPTQAPSLMLPNGMMLFVANFDGAIAAIARQAAEASLQTYYVLAQHKELKETKKGLNVTKTWTDPVPKLFRCVNNFITRASSLAENETAGLEHLPEQAVYTMAKIPYLMIQKLDQFFRLVDDRFGTEAVVVLTYDQRHDGSEGWGFVVPNQTNSAGHCKYDPASVVDKIPDADVAHVRQVGTAHSHPGMSAFASHTDHGDQLGNDGLHITFGWSGKSRRTEHHIELQVGSSTFICTEEMCFEDIPEPPNFGVELDELIKNVEKEKPYHSTYPYGGGPFPMGPGPTTRTSSGTGSGGVSGPRDRTGRTYVIPVGCPDPRDNIIVAELLNKDEAKCPVCRNALVPADCDRRKCWNCGSYLALPGEEIEELIEIRATFGPTIAPCFELMGQTPKPVARWNRWLDSGLLRSKVVEVHSGVGVGGDQKKA